LSRPELKRDKVMWGRLLLIAVGVAAGVIGKMVYDEAKTSSSSGSAISSPR